ncbi:hypothetical protein QR97_38235 [Streptomyces sp. PBH53]|uniref:streptophobe family protein n=1 Tax=Streptomyces sp. PBH53 TaxID=1577075 RepID=UPI00065512A5|nr:streptophobe family protein [Streptomyces sp. PBH53]AKN74780.1 hypothetical protein QR97_38235 [Streptomyces sp. PBH53]
MSPPPAPARPVARHGWPQAVRTVLTGLAVMVLTAALGLWAAGAADLPDDAFPRVVAATVVTAVGGSVELSGDAGVFARTRAALTVLPLSVTLAGALVLGAGFLRPLRHRAVASAGELAGWAARLAALWLPALIGLAFAARQTFAVDVGSGTLSDLADLFDAAPRIGFTTEVPLTVLFGLLWLAGVLLLALLVSLTAHDGRMWWLVVVDAVLLLAVAFRMAVRSPARIRPWQHALHLAVALALSVLTVCLTGRVSAYYGLSLLGIGDLGGDLAGELLLRPRVWQAVGLGALWGLVAGFLGGLLARPVRRGGSVDGAMRRRRGPG